MLVFVIDANRRPLSPCHPARARDLLGKRKAAVFRLYPFTIILNYAVEADSIASCQIKIDPGSKTTGIAVVNQDGIVIWGAELEHRGWKIRDALERRKKVRQGRRRRNTRYRAARFLHRTKERNWLPPSLEHRVRTIMTWVSRIIRYVPVGGISQELVRFDTQAMEKPNVAGLEYQQGDLAGYEVREYLLEKWERKCAYCGVKNVPLEIDHVIAKSKGGSNRISNLTISCRKCNVLKDDRPVHEFLSGNTVLLQRILNQLKTPLKDAAAVNSTRLALFAALKGLHLPIEVATGGRTKFNRRRLGLPKAHWIDAACVGIFDGIDISQIKTLLIVTCRGQGGRQKAVVNRYGQPIRHRPLRPIEGWRTGDVAKFDGCLYRISTRSGGSFDLNAVGKRTFARRHWHLARVSRADGYSYSWTRAAV